MLSLSLPFSLLSSFCYVNFVGKSPLLATTVVLGETARGQNKLLAMPRKELVAGKIALRELPMLQYWCEHNEETGGADLAHGTCLRTM
ncbi:hypothetical protein L2E82_21111 [Cichorium intybus]|uniref:Uncharacterized protein n=1 Tax=Cichorium intybus TaxID=13427 RepID=A0ACB9DUV6_CICIN|nr:hypothetical protein L2E82_21111 [Cichorium intybus]